MKKEGKRNSSDFAAYWESSQDYWCIITWMLNWAAGIEALDEECKFHVATGELCPGCGAPSGDVQMSINLAVYTCPADLTSLWDPVTYPFCAQENSLWGKVYGHKKMWLSILVVSYPSRIACLKRISSSVTMLKSATSRFLQILRKMDLFCPSVIQIYLIHKSSLPLGT